MKYILPILLLVSSNVFSKNVYIDEQIGGPKQAQEQVKSLSGDVLVLDTSVSRHCSAYNDIKPLLEQATSKFKTVYVIKDTSCLGVSSVIRSECSKFKNCKIIERYEANSK